MSTSGKLPARNGKSGFSLIMISGSLNKDLYSYYSDK
jgi:hypothetical protein